MKMTPMIYGLARTGLSHNLASHAAAWLGSTASSDALGEPACDWVRYVFDISWQACVRHRHASARLGALDASLQPLNRDDFIPADCYTREFLQAILLRAVIAAAFNGGQLDELGRTQAQQKLCELGLSAEQTVFLLNEMQRPRSVRRLARDGKSVPIATAIYVMSVLTIDTTSVSTMLYLTALADELGLEPALAAQIHRSVDGQAAKASAHRRAHHARTAQLRAS